MPPPLYGCRRIITTLKWSVVEPGYRAITGDEGFDRDWFRCHGLRSPAELAAGELRRQWPSPEKQSKYFAPRPDTEAAEKLNIAMGAAMPRRGEEKAVLEFNAPGGYGLNPVIIRSATAEAKRLSRRKE